MGVYLSEPITTKKTVVDSQGNISFCSSEMQGWRKNMEDAAIHTIDIGDGNSLFAVFDGHGGSQVSEYAGKFFTELLKGLPEYASRNYEGALDLAFKKIDEMMLTEEGAKNLHLFRYKTNDGHVNYLQEKIANGCGCTANVMLMTPDKYYVANAGDSRSVLSRSGKALELSFDHKPESPIESSRIKKAGGVIQMGRVNGGLNLSRSLGDFDYKQNTKLDYSQQMITCKPDIKIVPRSSDDEFIIMGCDGIWQKYVDDNQGMIDLLKKKLSSNKDLKFVVEDLLDSLLAEDTNTGLGCDNMTAILISLR